MKKIYIRPAIELEEAQAEQMMMIVPQSLPIEDDTVNGENALTKEDNAWDIWSE